MDNESFTGINIEELKRQIQIITDIIGGIVHGGELNLGNFFRDLRRNWASQNAVKFSADAKKLITAYLQKIGAYGDEILNDLMDSLNKYLSTLGESSNYSASDSGWKNYALMVENWFDLDEKNTDGVSGMNIRLVEDLLINSLPQIKAEALSEFDAFPSNISFFDSNSAQQSAYSTRIQAMKNLIEELATELETQIRSYINIEKNNILLAKQQVVQNMNGSSTTNA